MRTTKVVWLVIETEMDGGDIRIVDGFDTKEEAIEDAISTAEQDGYFDTEQTAVELRGVLMKDLTYTDGEVRTTITSCRVPIPRE